MQSLSIDDKPIKVQVWDTAGQERFRSISQSYYRNAHACIAVYDVTNRDSFTAISSQVENFINNAPEETSCNILLVGNKVDLAEDKREVEFSDACQLAEHLGLAGVIETSAKEGT